MHCHFVFKIHEIQSGTRLTFSQSQHSERLLHIIAHKQTIKCNPFDL